MTKTAVPATLRKDGNDICVQLIHISTEDIKSNSGSLVSTASEEDTSIVTDDEPIGKRYWAFVHRIPKHISRWRWKWKWKWNWNKFDPEIVKRFPYFVVFVSILEVTAVVLYMFFLIAAPKANAKVIGYCLTDLHVLPSR